MEISLGHAEKSKLGIREIMRCESEIHNSRSANYACRATTKHGEALQHLAELVSKVGLNRINIAIYTRTRLDSCIIITYTKLFLNTQQNFGGP
jgi:hypothetical protein